MSDVEDIMARWRKMHGELTAMRVRHAIMKRHLRDALEAHGAHHELVCFRREELEEILKEVNDAEK